MLINSLYVIVCHSSFRVCSFLHARVLVWEVFGFVVLCHSPLFPAKASVFVP